MNAVAFPTPETSPVLIVDDDAALLGALEDYIARLGYPVRGVTSPDGALEELRTFRPSVLIVDLGLGDADGMDVLRTALEERGDLATIAMTGVGNEEAAARCFRLGVSDYLTKPFDLSVLGHSIQRALIRRASELHRYEREKHLREAAGQSEALRQKAALTVLRDVALVVEMKHPFLRGHSERVGALCEGVGRYLNLPQGTVELLGWAGLIHDVGMIAAPDTALATDGVLTAAERDQVRSHVTLGGGLVRGQGMEGIADWVELHHERLDGSGYPKGLVGKQIPREALIVGVAEAFTALTEPRPHREACPAREAIEILRGAEGVWFPARLIDAVESSLSSGPPHVADASA